MQKSRERAIKSMISTAGLICQSLEITGGNHVSARLQAADKTCRKFIFSATPSDWRGDRNRMSMLRRFATEHGRCSA